MPLTISKWDASLTIPDLSISNAIIKTYALATSSLYPEGGHEWELTLNKKPPRNYFTIPFTAVNLRAYYQPPLTEEFKQEDCEIWTETHIKTKEGQEYWRPEEVVGSYAIYHASKSYGVYKTGKLFHIYRPKLTDANDVTVWGTIKISNSEFTISAPQDFLDNAVYPVVIDPTFGKTSIGASHADGQDPNTVYGCKYTTTEACTVDSISIYGRSYYAGKHIHMAIYDTSGNRQGGTTDIVAWSDSDSWVTAPYSSDKPSLSASTTYILAWQSDSGYNYNYYDSGASNQSQRDTSQTYPTMPASLTWADWANYAISIYATYTTGGGGLSIPVAMHHYRNLMNGGQG